MNQLPTLSRKEIKHFRQMIYKYYTQNRRSFPWRETSNTFHILVSEFMLQQTQTERVIPKYLSFIQRFNSPEVLAEATLKEVLGYWQGLGYNRRAKYIYNAAIQIVDRFDGHIPSQYKKLLTLAGVGPYTASAVLTFAYNKPRVFIETNIRSVFIHTFFQEHTNISDAQLLFLIEQTLDKDDPRNWYYALMDYGVHIKKQYGNPNTKSTHYHKQSAFKGSDREIRGKVLRYLQKQNSATISELKGEIGETKERLTRILRDLVREELLQIKQKKFSIP